MNSYVKLILKSRYLKVLFFLVLIFFVVDYINLKNYNIYEGKIIGFEEVIKKEHGYRTSVLIKHKFPTIEYYKNNDTIEFDDGRRTLFSNFKINEKVTVLESKENHNQAQIFSFFSYLISFEKSLVIVLLSLIIYGVIKLFKKS